MGRPKTPWHVARVALLEISRGAFVRDAAAAAGISVGTVERLIIEHDRVDQLSAAESDQEPGAFPHRESGTETAVSRNT